MKAPNFEGAPAASFSQRFASSLANSQVHVERRRLRELSRRVITYCDRNVSEPTRLGPYALVVSPDAQHALFGWSGYSDLFGVDGCAELLDRGDLVALNGRVLIRGAPIGYDKQLLEGSEARGDALARRVDGERHAAVIAHSTRVPGGFQPPDLSIQAGGRDRRDLDWYFTIKGRAGVAAIGADFSVVLGLDDGQVQVFALLPNERKVPTLVAERSLGAAARWLSIVGQRIMLIVPDGTDSKLQVLNGDATPAFTLKVPFDVLQPPIAGSGKRAYVAGKGLLAIDDEEVVWSHPSAEPIYASTFQDGSLAIATGKRLELVKTDGSIDQSFSAEEPLVVPPAIAGDGSVWVASATALYVAR